jgi:purine-nucleoside phosphorylase
MNTGAMNTATTPEPDEFTRAEQAAQFILAALAQNPAMEIPRIAVVLGSGLGDFAGNLQPAVVIAYEQIPFFPRSTAIGHVGRLVIGKLGDVTVAVMQGRVHQYEGYTAKQAAFPIRVLGRLGVRALVLTNAAGGINPQYGEEALVLISDHINLQGANPLSGPNDERFGPRFPDMTKAYTGAYRQIALDAGRKHGMELHEGVYAALAGPSYETPAEIRCLRAIGADLVGMSTVPEVIVARHMGIGVLAISCVTNMAAGLRPQQANNGLVGDPLSPREINHQEVLATGARVRGKLLALLGDVIPGIEESFNPNKSTSGLSGTPGSK